MYLKRNPISSWPEGNTRILQILLPQWKMQFQFQHSILGIYFSSIDHVGRDRNPTGLGPLELLLTVIWVLFTTQEMRCEENQWGRTHEWRLGRWCVRGQRSQAQQVNYSPSLTFPSLTSRAHWLQANRSTTVASSNCSLSTYTHFQFGPMTHQV